MLTYILPVMAAILLTSAVIAFILYKNKLFDVRILLAIAASSILICVLFPVIYNGMANLSSNLGNTTGLILDFTLTFIIYLLLVLVLSIVVTTVFPARAKKAAAAQIPQVSSFSDTKEKIDTENNVDSKRNIDKMGIETVFAETIFNETVSTETISTETSAFGQEINMSLEDCVNEAFRLKTKGDLEGAILYYMYALDNNPERDLVFLIVLDICSLYKTLGQIDLARDILESYVNGFGGLMDYSIRVEIERNLQEM